MTKERIRDVIEQWLKCHDCDSTTPEECDKCGEELPEGEFVKALNEAVKILGANIRGDA